MGELQKEISGKLHQLLKDEQKKQLNARPQGLNPGPPGGNSSQLGQVMTTSEQNRLKLTAEQKKQLGEIQNAVDGKLAKILSDDQRKQIKNTRGGFGAGGPGGPPNPTAFAPGGRGGPGGPPQPGQIMASFLQDTLKLTKDQKRQLEEYQKEVNDRLDKLLMDEQKKQLQQPQGGAGGRAVADFAQPGQLMALTVQIRLKLTADQRKQLQKLQEETDGKLDKLLGNDQKKQFKEVRANFGRGGPGGAAGPAGPGRGGPAGFGPGGPGGLPGGGPSGSSLFRAYRYAANYAGLVGKDLTPGKTVEELQAKEENKPPPDRSKR